MGVEKAQLEKMLLDGFLDADLVEVKDLAGDSNHYSIRIISNEFIGKSKVQQHKIVYKVLGDIMGNELHACSIETDFNTIETDNKNL